MSAKLLVDQHELAELIARSVGEVLDAHGLHVCKVGLAAADLVDGEDLERLFGEIGRNTAACVPAIAIDESEAP